MKPNRRSIRAWGPAFCVLAMCGCGERSVSLEQRLVEASGVVRPMEGRLAAVPEWAECEAGAPVPVVSLEEAMCARAERSPARVAAVGRLVGEEVSTLDAEERRRAQALIGLLWNDDEGELGSAVVQLEELTGTRPADAALWSDLAAARLLRAERTASSYDLLGALDAAERALESDPDRVEALFNRALVLEKLGLLGLAEGAWGRFVETEADPAWRREGEGRLARVRGERESAPGGNEEVRLEALRTAWPAWARAIAEGAGDPEDAWARLERLGRRHAAVSGDPLLLEAAGHAATLDPEDRLRLARAVLDLEAGSRALEGLAEGAPTARLLASASSELERLGSPLVHWARLKSVIAAIYEQRWAEVGPAAQELATAAADYPVVHGRALWMQGLALCYRGDRATAIRRYDEARTLFESSGERVFAGAVRFWSRRATRRSNHDQAWPHRYRALVALPLLARAEPYRAHNVLYDSASASLEQGWARPARDFSKALGWRGRGTTRSVGPRPACCGRGR
ncbi:MAG: hypothetical protein R2991_07350 [Thermoanaerobaculia bacterium]